MSMTFENTARVALTEIEEASAFQHLLDLGLDAESVGRHTGRPVTDIERRLAVTRLPKRVLKMLDEDVIEWSEAALLTEVAGHPEDIKEVLKMHREWRWDISTAVARVQEARTATEKAKVTKAKLVRDGVTIIDRPQYGAYDNRSKERELGGGYRGVDIRPSAHRKEPCHAAYIGDDGSAVFVCVDPQRHAPEPEARVELPPTVKAERAAKRAANKARRDASAARTQTATALLTGDAEVDGVAYVIAAVLDHAPREILPAAARLLGLDVPAGQQWGASQPAELALRGYASQGADARLRVALAVHMALAEKDAAAEFPAHRGGPGVIAYTDFLVENGYAETAGDAANRDRYRPRDAEVAGSMDEGGDDADDGGEGADEG